MNCSTACQVNAASWFSRRPTEEME
uniref:Uncharacterized protein n=1 Tax=Arundo donax TaxID=35708 RepID=A0A0A8ZA98_ARUDO